MSYISADQINDTVIVWERGPTGRVVREYPAPYYFFIKDEDGDHESIFGDKLSKRVFSNGKDFRATRDDLKSSGVELFESDLSPTQKILSQYYYKKEAPKLNVTFLDIEVDYDKEIGFSTIENPYAPINSIALYHDWRNEYVVYAVPPKDGKWIEENGEDFDEDKFIQDLKDIAPFEGTDVKFDLKFCKDESELLKYVIGEIEDSDLTCGWNSDFFDIPYIAKRLEMLGTSWFRKLEFPEGRKPRYREVEMFGNKHTTCDTVGRLKADYMVLFKKYEMALRPSYKLEAIADEVVPHLPKLHYEGTLADLYKNDFTMFIRYNIRDTEILKGFEDTLGYVALANEMYHISTGVYQHVGGTLKLAELAINNYCVHELDLRFPDVRRPDITGSIQGAFVLMPQIGMHDNIGSVDINSLYPSAIRSINISPETLIGQFIENVRAAEEIAKDSFVNLTLCFETGEEVKKSASEWRTVLKETVCAVSGYGTVFTQKKKGIIPAILEDWYNTRKMYQKKKADAMAAGDKELAAYYDRLQYVYKIKLNSLYGALNNQYFRYYDLRMGESTTATGRAILLHQCAKVCELLDGEYMLPDIQRYKLTSGEYVEMDTKKSHDGRVHFGYSDKWSVTYGDTDSSYFVTHGETEEESVMIADAVGRQISDSFPEFMRETFVCSPGFDNIILTGREIVASKGIFVDKKRYILRVVDNEGEKCDKLKVMGLDTKKTTIPKEIGTKLNGFVGRLLHGEEWDGVAKDIVEYKTMLETTNDINLIGLPKGVQNVEHYTKEYQMHGLGAKLPGHVAASIFYNQCLKDFNDKDSMPISSGTKIRVYYLDQVYGKFKSIAIPTDIEVIPPWFLDNFTILREAHVFRLVDKPLGNIIKAIKKDVPTKQGLIVESLLEF